MGWARAAHRKWRSGGRGKGQQADHRGQAAIGRGRPQRTCRRGMGRAQFMEGWWKRSTWRAESRRKKAGAARLVRRAGRRGNGIPWTIEDR